MGSRRLITGLLVCLFIYNDIKNTQANHQEERHEYQYQRSSKVVGGSGYYNSRLGNVEETTTNLDGWTQTQRDQVQGMAEKLRSELNTAQPGQYYQTGSSYTGSSVNGQGCNTICALIPGFVGRTQEEIDSIAKDMTSQIIADLQSGKLVRSQMNQPNWFEHQVAQKIIELRKHHQEQYQQNVYRASSRFHENQGSQIQPSLYPGSRTYSKDTEDVQQQQENVFSDDDLRQVQQNVFDQRQHQQQGNFYQQQSQNQQHTVYTRPVQRYYNTQTTSRDSANEERIRTVYPTPIVVTNNVIEEKNFTSSGSTASVPQIHVYNQYGRTDKEMEDRQYTQTQSIPTVVPSYDRSYYAQREYEERQRNAHRPVTYPSTSQTIETSQTTSERERTIPIVTPTQRTITTNVHVEQEDRQVQRQPQPPRVYNYGHEEKTEERETFHRNRQNVVLPTRRTSYEIRNTEQEQKVVEVHTPSPVPVTNKHSIYSHVEESEVVPNYQPRVVIDKNTEFEVLDHRREKDYRPQVPVTQTQTTVHESELEERRRHHVPIPTRPSTQTTYRETHNESEETEAHAQVTPRYQPSTSHHVITSETEETRTQHRPRPYPVYTSHGRTIEQNQSTTSTTSRRPNYPIYPSFKSNTTKYENGDSYIISESHIPTTYIIELTVEEYEERLHRLREELIRLGYGRLSEEEYNATIATGGFTHNGYKYLYNENSGRFEKTSRIETNDEEYEVIYETLQQKLREIGFGEMCEQEVKQTITTGVFIRDGSKFVYDSGREQYERIRITDEERRQIFARIQELLRRLGYRLLTQKENEGVLINGHFIRAAYQWIYNIVDGTVEKTIYVGDFAEFTDDEYREIYQKIQDTLRSIGYAQMSGSQCNATIISGTFERGGIYWSYNPNNGEFERIILSQEEYRDRVQILRDELRRLGHRELSTEEYRKVIYQGYFYHGGYRYEYVKELRRYERVELSADEYWERLRQLKQQLIRIGYGTMNEAECNSTITSGKFYYGGYEWVYSFETRDYQMGNKSNIDPTVNGNTGKDTSKFDTTKYDSTKPEEAPIPQGNGHYQPKRHHHGIISRNRGDQPPQHFDEDYESDEILEEEPGMGYYPTGKKPEIGLATPETFEQIRETTSLPTTIQPQPQYVVPRDYQRDRQRHEQQLTTQVWPTQPETISERRYHRKQTTYTQTTGLLPQPLVTQRSMRHVPGNELGDDQEQEENSTPYEPLVVSTQAYLVGNERPYNPNDQNEFLERYLTNERHRSAAVDVRDNNNYQQQDDLKSENIEDLGQQYEDFNGQQEDDVQQQLIDWNAEVEDLRQQQVDISKDDRNGQQKFLDTYAQESSHNGYNAHYHGEKETADEYEAEVVEVTEKADKESEESPGLWRRFKDKTKEFFG